MAHEHMPWPTHSSLSKHGPRFSLARWRHIFSGDWNVNRCKVQAGHSALEELPPGFVKSANLLPWRRLNRWAWRARRLRLVEERPQKRYFFGSLVRSFFRREAAIDDFCCLGVGYIVLCLAVLEVKTPCFESVQSDLANAQTSELAHDSLGVAVWVPFVTCSGSMSTIKDCITVQHISCPSKFFVRCGIPMRSHTNPNYGCRITDCDREMVEVSLDLEDGPVADLQGSREDCNCISLMEDQNGMLHHETAGPGTLSSSTAPPHLPEQILTPLDDVDNVPPRGWRMVSSLLTMLGGTRAAQQPRGALRAHGSAAAAAAARSTATAACPETEIEPD
eukprot:759061-Hanusia_phi.AAC.2